MKRFIKLLLENIQLFLEEKRSDEPETINENILRTITLAIRKQASVHVIFSNKHFTGDIIKYDKERQQLIVKNFEKNISTIIRIPDIKRISIVPATISLAQKSKL